MMKTEIRFACIHQMMSRLDDSGNKLYFLDNSKHILISLQPSVRID